MGLIRSAVREKNIDTSSNNSLQDQIISLVRNLNKHHNNGEIKKKSGTERKKAIKN